MADRTLKLREPIELLSPDGAKVVMRLDELTVRAPKLGDLVAAMNAAGGTKDVGSMLLHLAARLTGAAPRDIEGLGLEDGAALLEMVGDFMPAGLTGGNAGSKSSPASSASHPTGAAGGQPS